MGYHDRGVGARKFVSEVYEHEEKSGRFKESVTGRYIIVPELRSGDRMEFRDEYGEE